MQDALFASVLTAAREAGAVIMEIYETDFKVRGKADASPVTAADEAAENVILAALARHASDIPAISEEQASKGRIPEAGQRFWLVDPLDGTKEFISRNGEFTVNIALIERGRPVAGVVFAPALNRLYAGRELRDGSREAFMDANGTRHSLRCRTVPDEGLTVVSSRSHGDAQALDAFLAGRRVAASVNAGSSLKLCLVAAGDADLYPRLGRTMEWDIAAGHAVLNAAGGSVRTLDGSPLLYGKPGLDNPHFVASGDA
ncbi:3'(2'),5'-bisphosphate nucleotidase CysQ [Paraburkholderia phymatum]|uniref:3'(2'),5'-bisphosphate nucleotidase CysQ n=1 Tax=Paraburkholderia phymatum TaxID=148447 RepID=UPI00317C1AAD